MANPGLWGEVHIRAADVNVDHKASKQRAAAGLWGEVHIRVADVNVDHKAPKQRAAAGLWGEVHIRAAAVNADHKAGPAFIRDHVPVFCSVRKMKQFDHGVSNG
ncbi:MAG TPA: hypothetical protein DHV59_11760 [Oxalobacteraceae bacterium]|nr:hypothetical protein [Oxalobacteraceae bacterium]